MKCPKCGTTLRDEELYCGKCGAEIQIVPEYDTVLEHNIMESIEKIAADLAEDIRSVTQELPVRYGRKRICAAGICILVVVVSIVGILVWQYHDYDYQLRKANACLANEEYAAAIHSLKRALALDSADSNVSFALADAYKMAGRKDEYREQLEQLTGDPSLDAERKKTVYYRLIGSYEAEKDYQSLSRLLAESGSEELKTSYQKYLAAAPSFSYESGSYEKVIPLKLTTMTIGTVYYTLDGTEPTEESQIYTAPILLEGPDVTVKAIAVNQYGVVSEAVSARYHIETNYKE